MTKIYPIIYLKLPLTYHKGKFLIAVSFAHLIHSLFTPSITNKHKMLYLTASYTTLYSMLGAMTRNSQGLFQ